MLYKYHEVFKNFIDFETERKQKPWKAQFDKKLVF